MDSAKNRSISQVILEILRGKSRKSLIYARKIMLAEKIQSADVQKALQYYVNNWDISTHPAPFIIAYEAVGGDPKDAVEIQAAIVMLSAALDIHDDIIDKSIKKRGKLTVAGKFGPDIALLLGNAFLIKGFSLLSMYSSKLSEEKKNEVIRMLKEAMFEVGDAHALELNFRGKIDVNPEEYLKILQMKAVTTQVTMQLGAMFGGGTAKEIGALAKYGRILGTLAALREEFIDIFDAQELNQRIHKECLPIPILYAIQDRYSKEIKRIISQKTIKEGDVYKLLEMVLESPKVKELKEKMEYMIRNSAEIVREIKNEEIKALLTQLTQSMIEDIFNP